MLRLMLTLRRNTFEYLIDIGGNKRSFVLLHSHFDIFIIGRHCAEQLRMKHHIEIVIRQHGCHTNAIHD